MTDKNDWDELNEQMAQLESTQAETPLPSLEEQKAIAAKLKQLEAEGKLTPEILAEHFAQFNDTNEPPVH